MLAALATMVARSAPVPTPNISLPGAQPIAYEAIRDASGVLGYAESLLGPTIATAHGVQRGPGASLVNRSAVVGAWELPQPIRTQELTRLLRTHGVLDRVSDHRDGQI